MVASSRCPFRSIPEKQRSRQFETLAKDALKVSGFGTHRAGRITSGFAAPK
jgi:hypothetical protein